MFLQARVVQIDDWLLSLITFMYFFFKYSRITSVKVVEKHILTSNFISKIVFILYRDRYDKHKDITSSTGQLSNNIRRHNWSINVCDLSSIHSSLIDSLGMRADEIWSQKKL